MNGATGRHAYIVHVALSASLHVADEYTDLVHRRAVVKQRAVLSIGERNAAHPPPDYASIQEAVQGTIVDAAVVITQMLLSVENRQPLAASKATAELAQEGQAQPGLTEADQQLADQQVARDAETQMIRQRVLNLLQSAEQHTAQAEVGCTEVDAYQAVAAAAP